MISAWDIYWVMQLDSINGTLTWIAVLASFSLIVCAFAWAACNFDDGIGKRVAKWLKATLATLAVTFLLGTFIPSTKTAAMMLVIPAVANNEAIQREAGDLYGIAKDALRELAKPKQEAAK